MTFLRYQFYQCQNKSCGLRFPALVGSMAVERCPRCKSPLECVGILELSQEDNQQKPVSGNIIIEALLDNIRSAWNVGSMFRTAGGAGLQRIYLGGITPTPSHPKVGRTALGAEMKLPWQYASNAESLVRSLIDDGRRVWVLEDVSGSVNLFDLQADLDSRPILLVVGNEACGVDPGIIKLSERSISIPMVGSKRSYNVAVAFGIAASYLRYCQSFSQGSMRILPNT